MSCSPTKRRDMDLMKLMMSNHEVVMLQEEKADFYVKFRGPKDSPYEGGVWKVHVEIPMEYPYRSPSIGFLNKIYHPNVDEVSGSVCLDVINQSWSPMFDLINIFESFLPQLLLYPNPTDPMNGEAAALMLRDKEKYEARIKEYVVRFASPSVAGGSGAGQASLDGIKPGCASAGAANGAEEEDELSELSDMDDAHEDEEDGDAPGLEL